jgi:signal transduction histidine kinase
LRISIEIVLPYANSILHLLVKDQIQALEPRRVTVDKGQETEEQNNDTIGNIHIISSTSPWQSLITAIVLVFIVEGIIMLIMPELIFLSNIEMALLDSSFLVILLLPALYLIIYKPLARQKSALEQTEKKLQEQLSQSMELKNNLIHQSRELTAANKSLESFIYLTAHDLRTPLRTLNGFSEILLEEYSEKLDEKGRSYLFNLRDGSQHMHSMLEGLLTLSRCMQSKLSPQLVDLSQMVQNITGTLKNNTPDRQVSVRILPNITAHGDGPLLQTLMEQLLDNAWKFTAHTPDALIEFTTEDRDGESIFLIRDNGVGFNMAYKEMLFMPFYLLHKTDEFEGVGVGLALTQKIIERHGGRIWAEAEVNKGATIFFTLNL